MFKRPSLRQLLLFSSHALIFLKNFFLVDEIGHTRDAEKFAAEGGRPSIYLQFRLNGASLFGSLKPKLREKMVKIAIKALILFVDSHFLLIYSHRYIEVRLA